MEEGFPKRAKRRGIRRWIWAMPVILPVLGLAAINLCLASKPGRAWMAGKIQARTRLEASVGGATFLPWNGLRIHEVRLLPPPALREAVDEPLMKIQTIGLSPVWKAWLRGRLELNSITLDQPQWTVPVELLAEIAKSRTPPQAAAPPPQVAAPPPPEVAAETPSAPVAAPPAAAPVPPPVQAPVSTAPTAWIHVKDASFTLLSASSKKLWFQTSGIRGSIPVAGGNAESVFEIGSIRIADHELVRDLRPVLQWRTPFLAVKPMEGKLSHWGEFHYQIAARIGLVQGLPLQIEVRIPEQAPGDFKLPEGIEARAAMMAGSARFRGLLLAPQTWQGDWVAEAKEPAGKVGGQQAAFDRGSAIVVLRGGLLSCVDARLIGDELSFLGNATLLADGRVAAALRMVAPPANVEGIVNRLFQNQSGIPLTPLSTPQRTAFDVQAFGNLQQIYLQVGKEGPVMQLRQPMR
jgi:hypothetical protein